MPRQTEGNHVMHIVYRRAMLAANVDSSSSTRVKRDAGIEPCDSGEQARELDRARPQTPQRRTSSS